MVAIGEAYDAMKKVNLFSALTDFHLCRGASGELPAKKAEISCLLRKSTNEKTASPSGP
jgi:hypothetical protein